MLTETCPRPQKNVQPGQTRNLGFYLEQFEKQDDEKQATAKTKEKSACFAANDVERR